MENQYQSFDFFGKPVIERLLFTTPYSKIRMMNEEACFLYQREATNVMYSSSQKIHLYPQEAVVMKCGNYISKYFPKNTFLPSEMVDIHFYPDILRKIYKNDLPVFLQQSTYSSGTLIHQVKVDELIQGYIRSILFYFENPSLVTEELISLKIKELILLLIRTTENSQKIRMIFQELFNPSQINFLEVIESNLYEDLSIQELAILCDMSLASFNRKFKEVFKESPSVYLKNEKLEKAMRLLLATDMRVTEISWECGFGEVSHFTKVFKNKTGLTPLKFRKGTNGFLVK
ncbi:helix-turn-helix domain-containing protein [Algoriphagus resistens]|uniref:helix-turn-helix domain-containing protein n=1 Tax=Algoriphagus resistens TaxID=1750590 RepID=UPI000716A535|nr:helix-turn-helix domain-containing protein [Algoriphagus resistens]